MNARLGGVESRVPRREWLTLALVLLVAVTLRCARPGRLAVEHFDEGVYASDLWYGVGTGHGYPYRHLYAPPLVPLIAELALLMSGIQPAAPLIAGCFAGCLTVAVVWWIGRTWYGSVTGLLAAALAAVSDVHVVFSRTALTDPWLLLWFVAAMYWMERALRTRTYASIFTAGAFVALAWWTKYNGWLPLALAGATIPLAWIRGTLAFREVLRTTAAWSAVAAIAAAGWSPVLYGLQSHGGYSEVAANHQRYVVGLAGWPAALARQASHLQALEGWPTLLGAPLLVLFVLVATCVPTGGRIRATAPIVFARRIEPALIAALLLAAGTVWLGHVPTLAAGALIAIALQMTVFCHSTKSSEPRQQANSLAPELLGVWLIGLFFLTPLYHPYARLTLPWLAATWLGAAVLLGHAAERTGGLEPSSSLRPWPWLAAAAVLVALTVVGGWRIGPRIQRAGVPGWEDRSGLARATRQLAQAAREELQASDSQSPHPPLILYTLGEPAVFFHLQALYFASDWPVALPAGDLSMLAAAETPPDVPVMLIVGPHAFREFERAEAAQRLRPIARQSFSPSPALRLDHTVPRKALEHYWTLRLYRVH